MTGRWSDWSREGWQHVRRWNDGERCVEVRVDPPHDAAPLLTGGAWTWRVLVDGREVRAGEIAAGTPAARILAPFHAMQAGREAAAQNGMSSLKSPAGGTVGAARPLALA